MPKKPSQVAPQEPEVPSELLLVKVTPLEADMLQKIRRYPYGEFTVVKVNGEPIDVIIGGRERLDRTQGYALAVSVIKVAKVN